MDPKTAKRSNAAAAKPSDVAGASAAKNGKKGQKKGAAGQSQGRVPVTPRIPAGRTGRNRRLKRQASAVQNAAGGSMRAIPLDVITNLRGLFLDLYVEKYKRDVVGAGGEELVEDGSDSEWTDSEE